MPKSREQLKQEYIDSLDSFISKNPTVGQLDTAKFRDFLIGLVEHESGFNPTAKQGSYFGGYQTNKLDYDPYAQHMNAFNHLNDLFKNTITKEDVQKARSLGINDSTLMLKYGNQGNRVNNYLGNNKDSADGLGTLISNYGNDLTMPLDVYGYAMDNLYGDYTVKKGDNGFNIQKRVRIPGRDYATGGKDLWIMQKLSGAPFGSLKIGQSFNFGNKTNKRYEGAQRDGTEEETPKLDLAVVKKELPSNLIQARRNMNNRIINSSETKSSIKPRINSRPSGIPTSTVPTEQEIRNLVYNAFKYQKGGMVYTGFDQESLDFRDFDTSDSKFPVEPVVIYKPKITNPTPVTVEQPYTPAPLIPKGIVEYKSNDIDIGNMKELVELMKNEGISFRITSGSRPGALTSKGLPSHHGTGDALDITPIQGQTGDDLINQMKRSKRFLAYMKEHKLGILDERSQKMLAKTGGTGAHFHIGPDLQAISNFNLMFG